MTSSTPILEYKGFKAIYEYHLPTQSYVAETINSIDLISFSSDRQDNLFERMKEAVENYLHYLRR